MFGRNVHFETLTDPVNLSAILQLFHGQSLVVMEQVLSHLNGTQRIQLSQLSRDKMEKITTFVNYKLCIPSIVPSMPIGVISGQALGEPTT